MASTPAESSSAGAQRALGRSRPERHLLSAGVPTDRASLALAASPGRQRSLLSLDDLGGGLPGWFDDDAATAAGQLWGGGPGGPLIVDARELLVSTARVVGVQLGEIHFKAWMALVTLHVAHGMPATGLGASSIGEFNRVIWGADKETGGSNTKKLVKALYELRHAVFHLPGHNIDGTPSASMNADTQVLINFGVDTAILSAYGASLRKQGKEPEGIWKQILQEVEDQPELSRGEFGKLLGGKGRGTIAWRMHPDYVQRLAEADLRRFDWSKAQSMRGVALALWMTFTSPRMPYRPVFEAPEELQILEVPLTESNCHALGVHAGTDAARRRTFNDAGPRVCAADTSFRAFEAHGGRGRDSFLRVVRVPPRHAVVERPLAPVTIAPTPSQLTLADTDATRHRDDG